MKKLLYLILAGGLTLSSCNNAQESTEHGHSHDGSSDHTHDAAGEEVPVKQEEFTVTDSTHSATDTTTAEQDGTHTHADGKKHKDHN